MEAQINKLSTMKKLIIYSSILIACLQAGCTKGFEELNTNPNASSPANFDAAYFIPSSQRNYMESISGYSGAILFQSGWAQIFASTTSGGANYYSNADKYAPSSNTNTYMANSWGANFTGAGRAQEVIKNVGDDPAKINLRSAAVIMKVLNLAFIADLYGAIPYSEALLGDQGNTSPKYDSQQAAYLAMLADLEGALQSFNPSLGNLSADAFSYDGDINKWKRFGYSLMLRMAMRLVKVDANLAKTWAEKAAAGGTLSGVAEDCYIQGDNANGYSNANTRALITPADFYQVRWSKTFIDYLKSRNDPRLSAIAEVPPAGLAANNNLSAVGDNTAANQLGLPNGWDLNGGATDITNSPGYPGGTGAGADLTPIGRYSRPRIEVFHNLSNPVIILTYAETELLLAEAAVRGFSVGGTAAQHYQNAVAAALQSLSIYGSAATIAAGTATAYAAANPLDVSSPTNSLKQINEQYWATAGSYMNFVEAWNNWKRSGYPALTAVNYTGNFSSGQIPRRQPYPLNEATFNGANYQEAVSGLQGGDTWIARTWWDAN
jgi:hypothetical protein